MLDNITNTRVKAEVLLACKPRYSHLRTAVLGYIKKVEQGNEPLSYKCMASAFEALGAHGKPEDFELLKTAVSKYSVGYEYGYYPFISAGAINGLGSHRSREAYDFLVSCLPYGKLAKYLRTFAIKAVASLASWQDKNTMKRAVEELELYLGEHDAEIICAAVGALTDLNSKSSLDNIKNSIGLLPFQSKEWVQRKMVQLQENKGDDPGTNAFTELKGEIEKLQQRLTALEKKDS